MSHTRLAAGDAETAIELVDVAKAYTAQGESVAAVRKVDLAIRSGEFFSLLGPSGCGKTTTLRMVAGFEQPTQGQILLYGKDVVGVSAHQRDLNMVFQSYALFPHMNVYDNVAFGLRRKKVSKADVDRRVREMLTLVDLEGREKRRPHEMSGGQQQRVALARALVNEPRALLLDEPLGALDLKLRQAMQSELKRIQREVGITFVYVTHDQGEALTMSDRIAVMNQGVVEQLGTPREIYEQPRTRFVADFIGTSNFVTLQVTEAADRLVCDLGDDQRVVVPLREHRPTVGAHIEITVRPEKLQLADRRPVTDCAVRGEVTEVVYQGTFTAYVVRLPATGDVVQAHVQNVNDAFDIAAVGDRVWLGWDLSHSYLLTQDDAARAGSSGRDPVESSVTSEPAHAATRGETS